QTARVRHRYVEHDDVGPAVEECAVALLAGLGLADHIDVGIFGKQAAESGAHDRMVVDQQHAGALAIHGRFSADGIARSSHAQEPARRRARSPRAAGGAPARDPRPAPAVSAAPRPPAWRQSRRSIVAPLSIGAALAVFAAAPATAATYAYVGNQENG